MIPAARAIQPSSAQLRPWRITSQRPSGNSAPISKPEISTTPAGAGANIGGTGATGATAGVGVEAETAAELRALTLGVLRTAGTCGGGEGGVTGAVGATGA